MPQNARIRDEWIESTERIQIAATESHEADPEQHVRICEYRISDGLQIGLAAVCEAQALSCLYSVENNR